MATGPQIVHKQFNSPIGLYSQQNIKETLNKHMQNLDNGTVGIDFNQPGTDKPANLANSAVLRMLEEEERNRRGYPKLDPTQVQAILDTLVHTNHRFDNCWPPDQSRMRSARSWDGQLNTTGNIYSDFMKATKGQKKVVWPPTPETNGYHQPQQQSPAYHNTAQHSPSAPQPQQYQNQPNQYQNQPSQYQNQPSQYQNQPQYSPQPNQYQSQPQYPPQQSQYQQPQSQPSYCEGKRQEATGLSKLIPFGPGVTASPASPSYRQGPPSPGVAQPYRQPNSRWAPVPAPLSPQTQGSQPSYPQQQYSQPQYSPQQQHSQPQYAPQPQYSPNQYSEPYQPPQRQFEPPPSTITLRPQPPVHQQPPPVYTSQPAAASFKGGVNMRGDQKWPPQSVKEAVAAENEARMQLARGPACRPRKVKKDYSSFFAQHALTNNYPGYRAPPGTQHYEDFSGRSSY